MEPGNGTASHRDEHDRPDRSAFRMHVGQSDFRDMIPFEKQTAGNTDSHEDQAEAEERIQFPDQLINRQERSTEIIEQQDNQPEVIAQRGDLGQQAGRASGEGNAYQDQQDNGEATHDVTHGRPQVFAAQFGNGCPIIPFGQYAGNEVMDTTCKHSTERDPQEYGRTPHSTSQSTEDRTQAGNVQQLNQENSPVFHRYVVNTIFQTIGRSLSVIDRRTEAAFYVSAINEITSN